MRRSDSMNSYKEIINSDFVYGGRDFLTSYATQDRIIQAGHTATFDENGTFVKWLKN